MNRHDQLALHQSQFAALPYYSCISGTVFWKDFVRRVITITLGQLMKFSTYNRINIKISRYYYIQSPAGSVAESRSFPDAIG